MKRKTGPKEKNLLLHEQTFRALYKAQQHAEAFQKQIQKLVAEMEDDKLEERKLAGINYFSGQVINPCIASIEEPIVSLGTLAKVAKQVKIWKDLNVQLKQKVTEMKSNF